ncbi:POXA3b laccase small subunit [Pleurotus eryngii]|uniref:POXA3b laccase small subunit n=1 Tax=Pleurotus eryngii TaxID=5323 RepID=A0A9P6DGZ1_PLEER|nr:POXA3b laccase small subunit [Pleurotus eryngii]
MFASRSILFALVAVTALAKPLEVRQTTNTNAQIEQVVDSLDESIHIIIPNILTLQAQERATDATIGEQITQLATAFQTSTSDFAQIPISSGSTTDSPTNDEISVFYADGLQQVASGLSGLGQIPELTSLSSMMTALDPTIAASVQAFNKTLPGAIGFVNTLMLDAQQFLTLEGLTQTRSALGFA